MAMSEHDKIRELLALAAADALTSAEEKQVAEHVRSCIALLERIGGLAADCERTPPIADAAAFFVAGAGHAGACGGEAHRTGRARLEPPRNDCCRGFCVAADDCELAGFPLCERTFRELARAAVQPYTVRPNMDQFCRVHCARVARGRGGRSAAGNPAARRK